ncbi:hypothetical protein Dsin_005331 [Dipteronia sinensis]|uniref:HAT C-terminal dimerisation domain-containing protein n=1 Tax=Dipteronia sinensis TaxID=43782 RepID=A0AAE0AXP5_9ROSI|nr:hypothetical protein Dsin_005331 [Dipteronia sinensis]
MKGKGRMTDNLGHDDRAYHEYLQQQVYVEDLGLNFPHSHPSLRISEPDLNVTPILTSQSENMPDLGHDGDEHDDSDPNPHQDFDFYPQMEEKLPKQVTSDLFVLHMKKVMNEDGITVVICNYCKKVFKWHKYGGYGSYRKHITNSHPDAQAKSNSQSQIPILESLPDYLSVYYEQGLKIDYDVDMCCARVKTLLYELYDEYIKVYGPSLNIDVPQTQNVSRSSSSSSSFVKIGYFPILAMIAKQILSTPVSTVAVEQQFSAGGNILDPRRSLMSPKSLQIQACVEDWTKAQNRQQEIDQEEPYDFFKDDQPAESRTDDHGND